MKGVEEDWSGCRFGAIARLTLPSGSEVTLRPGIVLRPTYVHIFAHPIAAFAPPRDHDHHPAPWHPVSGRCDSDTALIEVVLTPKGPKLLPHADDVLRLIASVLRLLTARPVYLALASDLPLTQDVAQRSNFSVQSVEPVPIWREEIPELSEPTVDLLRKLLVPASLLFRDEDVFQAFTLADSVWWVPTQSARMTSIWTAAEVLMRPPEQGKAKGLAASIRAYLRRDGPDGDRRYNEVLRLYHERSRSAHAGREPQIVDLYDSFLIVREILLRAIVEGVRPPPLQQITPMT